MKKVVILLILFSFLQSGFALAQSSAYSAGDLIKTPYSSTVYYFGYDGKRHAFPNEAIYFSWYSNFEGIKIIAPEELAEVPLGHSIVVRPGTNLVKIQTDPKVYAIEPYGVLRHLPSEAMARALYGDGWAKIVVDIDVALFPNYTIGEPISYQYHPEGVVFRYENEGDKTYVLRNGFGWAFKDMVKAEKHRYQEKFILNLKKPTFNYQVGYKEIDEIHPILIDTAQTLKDDELFKLGRYAVAVPTPPPPPQGTGLMGYYYSDMNFGRQMLTRIDSMINFSWGQGSPALQMPSDYFSVRWLGKIKIDTAGNYDFYTWSDDGARLYVDGNLIINNWTDHSVMWDKGSIYLTSGYHAIRLEYYEKTGGAFIKLYWYDKYTPVPTEFLYPETTQYWQSD